MTESTNSPDQQQSAAATELWVDRTGTRRYVGHSSRGATVEIGSADVEGAFTPGELLKIALGACTAMASDFTISRRLGDDYAATVPVSSSGVTGAAAAQEAETISTPVPSRNRVM